MRQPIHMGRFQAAALLGALVLQAPAPACAQVFVKLQMEHLQLLRYETVNAFVSIFNESTEDMVLGGPDGARLQFSIERELDSPPLSISKKPLVEGLTIPAGQSRDVLRDISLWYDVGNEASYALTADVFWHGDVFRSNKIRIDVVSGLRIKSETRVFNGDKRFARQLVLRYLSREGAEHLFFAVEDRQTGVNYGVFDLGGMLRLYDPAVRVSTDGVVRILHLSGLDRYTMSTFEISPRSTRFIDQNYYREDGSAYGKGDGDNSAEEGAKPEGKAVPSRKRWSLFGIKGE